MRKVKLHLSRWPFFGAVCALIILATLFLGPHLQFANAGSASQTLTPIAGLGGPFSLQNQRGERVTEKNFLGKPTLYFFGFTHCPDVCPTTLYDLSARLKELGADGDKLNVVFVSVDPERDTVKTLADYMTAFDPRMIALTGTPQEVAAIVKDFHIYVKKGPVSHGDYEVNHTASIFAADSEGHVVMVIDHNETPDMVRTKLKRLLELKTQG